MITNVFRRFYDVSISVAMLANIIGTLLIFALVAILNADVFARGVLHSPIKGVVELVIFSLVMIVFLQLPDVVRSNRLTRSDGFMMLLGNSRPKAGKIHSRIINFVAGIFMCLVAWTMWPEFVDSFESCHFFTPPEFGPPLTGEFFTDLSAAFGRCDYAGTPGIFTAPTWPAKLSIGFSVTLCAIIFILNSLLDKDQDALFGRSKSSEE